VAGPSKVEFPGQKKQRMRARGTKRASEGVLKRLEKNLKELLENPHERMPIIAYDIRRGRRDPVQRSLKECQKVIAKKNDRKWLGKRMMKKRGDSVARALAGSLHAAHDDERNMVGVFDHPIFGSSSFVRRGVAKPVQLVSFQNHVHPSQRLLAWEDHARRGWWFYSLDGGIICTGNDAVPPMGWLQESLKDAPMKFTEKDSVYYSPSAVEGAGVRISIRDEIVILSENDLDSVSEKDSFARTIAIRALPPRLSDFAKVEWDWRPEGWPQDVDLSQSTQEKIDDVVDSWLNLALPDAKLTSTLRNALCMNIDTGCIVGERWWPTEDLAGMVEHVSGSAPEKAALELVFSEALIDGGLHIGGGSAEVTESHVIRMEENSCHANLVALWPEWGCLILEEIYGITGDDAEAIVEKQTKRKQGFGAFFKKMESERLQHLLLSRFPWKEGDMLGLCGYADKLIRMARIEGIGSTISMAKKGKEGGEKALGWAWINVHERAESEGWHFDSDSRDKGGDWVPALKALYDASEVLVEDGSSDDYIEAMKAFATRSGASDFVDV